MQRPAFRARDVYSACVAGIADPGKEEIYSAAAGEMSAAADQYEEYASAHKLHPFLACDWGNDEQVVLHHLTKGDLKRLYDSGMVGSEEGRAVYDKLLAAAPLGKCPYCWFGHADTLDHFLPKSRYPTFSVLPSNLVPACMRCNKGKGSGVLTEETELSHPYFEDSRIENDVWLVANINRTNPVTTTYSIVTPALWPHDLARRMRNYFQDFELAKRYAVEAASELVSVSAYLRDLTESPLRVQHLIRVAVQERTLSKNGWKSALYAALSTSDWYSETGYALGGAP